MLLSDALKRRAARAFCLSYWFFFEKFVGGAKIMTVSGKISQTKGEVLYLILKP
jgi:hypothetical protein